MAGLLGPAPAAARAQAAADGRAAKARQACSAGRVDEGVELLAGIYADGGDVNAIYNQARCYQQNGRPEQAMSRFREYLRVNPAVPAGERDQIEQYLRELEVELEERTRRELAARFPPPVAAPPMHVAPVVAGTRETAALPPLPREELEEHAEGSRWGAAAIAAGALGLAGVGAGAFFGWRATRIQRDIEGQSGPVPAREFQRRYDRGVEAQKLQWVGYGIGAAALTASAALLFVRF